MLALALLLPVVQLSLFGYAINTTVDHQATVVLDRADDRMSRDFIAALVNSAIPGLIGTILQNTAMLLIALSVVRERERGTLEQVIVSPIRSWELMLGKLVPYALIAFANVGLVLAVGTLWFRVEIAGSLW